MTRLWRRPRPCAWRRGRRRRRSAGRRCLPTLTHRGDGGGNAGFFGETFAQSAGVGDEDRHADPRDAALGQRRHPAADPGPRRPQPRAGAAVHARRLRRQLRQRQPRRLDRGARLRADDLPRRDAVRTSATTTTSAPEPFLLDSDPGAEGPVGDALRQRRRRRHRQRELEAARSRRAEHRRSSSSGPNSLFQSSIDVGGALGDGRILYRLVGLGRSADGADRLFQRRRRRLHAVADLDADREHQR